MHVEHVETARLMASECLGPMAAASLSLDRDESDSFDLTTRVRDTRVMAEAECQTILEPLLPVGSSWRHICGWRSIFGSEIRSQGTRRYCVGYEGILPHPSRGAYPVADLYLFASEKDAEKPLASLADRLAAAAPSPDAAPDAIVAGFLETTARRPYEHVRNEVAILRRAASAIADRGTATFATIALVPQRLPRLGQRLPSFRHRGSASEMAIGISREIIKRFPPQSRSYYAMIRSRGRSCGSRGPARQDGDLSGNHES